MWADVLWVLWWLVPIAMLDVALCVAHRRWRPYAYAYSTNARCRQEEGLTVEYDVMGMSSTHSEKRTDARMDHDGTDHGTGEHVVTGAEVPVDELLVRRRVTKFEAKLDAVEMTTTATHLAKHLGYTGKPKLPVGCTLVEAKRHLGRSCTEAVVALYDCAVDALLRAMDKRGALTTPAPPIRYQVRARGSQQLSVAAGVRTGRAEIRHRTASVLSAAVGASCEGTRGGRPGQEREAGSRPHERDLLRASVGAVDSGHLDRGTSTRGTLVRHL
jgi:hypothetical protein